MHQRFKIGVCCAVGVAIGVPILQRSLLEEMRFQLVLMASEVNEGRTSDNRSASATNAPIDLHSIVAKWKLVSPQAVSLLQQIADQPFDYDPSEDLLIFEHPFKTGGTSVSNVLKEMGGVVPGSHDSGYFNMRLFMETQEKELQESNMTLEDWWREKKVLYSHSMFRKGRGESSHTRILRSNLPPSRQLRILTMTRDPVAWTASSHSMSGCGYSRTLAHYVQALRLQAFGLYKGNSSSSSSSSDPCYGLSPSDLTDLKIKYDFGPKCRDKYETVKRSKRAVCDAYLANETDLFPQCRSISNFLHSSGYMDNAHNRQVNRVNTGINGTEADFENGALEHFGGLEQGENAPIPVMWVGITERMSESMCLLHYSLRLPYMETPRDRVMTCRPESRWTDSEKAIVREREILDYAVHRVANAILDVRLAKMRQELHQNASLLSMPYVGPHCLQLAFN